MILYFWLILNYSFIEYLHFLYTIKGLLNPIKQLFFAISFVCKKIVLYLLAITLKNKELWIDHLSY